MRNYMALFELSSISNSAISLIFCFTFHIVCNHLNSFSRFSPGIVVDVFLSLRIQVTVVHPCHPAVSRANIVQEVRVGQIRVEEDQGEDERDARSVRPVSEVTVVTSFCLDMVRFGGTGRVKQTCIMRQCLQVCCCCVVFTPLCIFTHTVMGISLC
jgi:CXXC zinc finger domain.